MVDMSDGLDSPRYLAKLLYCFGEMERYISQAYRSLASRVDDGLVKIVLEYIADDSMKHSNFLLNAARSIGDPGDCVAELREIVGPLATLIIEDAKKIVAETGKIPAEKIVKELERLADLEKFFGEEYFMAMMGNVILAYEDVEGMNLGTVRTILEYLVEDEKRHENLLVLLRSHHSRATD